MLLKLRGGTHDVEVVRSKNEYTYICICPLCADHSGHLEVDMKEGVWYCHRHQAGGALRSSAAAKKTAAKEAKEKKREILPLDGLAGCRRLTVTDLEFVYLRNRGMSLQKIKDLDPRLVAPGWVSVPHFAPDRSFLGFIHRRAGNDLSYKYRYTPQLLRVPWGLHRFKGDELVLVEGSYDAAGDRRAVALLGVRPSREAIGLLLELSIKRLVIALDGDAYDAARILARTIRGMRHHLEIRIARLKDDPDVTGIQTCIDISERFI